MQVKFIRLIEDTHFHSKLFATEYPHYERLKLYKIATKHRDTATATI